MPSKTVIMVEILIATAIVFIVFVAYLNLGLSPLPTTSPTPSPSSTPNPTIYPSPRISADLNWGGYAVATNFSNPQPVVTGVSGYWTVPQIDVSSTDTFSAIWVGIGGTFTNSLIQVGTEQDCTNGQVSYYAWYELLPLNSRTLMDMIVSPGDRIAASVTMEDPLLDSWSVDIHNLANNQSFHQSFIYYADQLSAEWIVERPTVNGQLSSLADFSQLTFLNCTAIVNGSTEKTGNLNFVQTLLQNRAGNPLVEISNITSDGSSFSVKYLVTS